MTLIKHLRALFFPASSLPIPAGATRPGASMSVSANATPAWHKQSNDEAVLLAASSTILPKQDPLPDWLTDDDNLRDEGVLFGLSDARPDGKLAQIRAHFSQQSAPFAELIEQYTEKIGELNLFIEQRENRIIALRDQLSDLRDSQLTPNNLIRNTVSLLLSVILCIGNFYLIDDILRPAFPNRWITVGIFLAGMFNLFGRTSFFYETDTRLTNRRLIEEVGLPLASSIFVFVQALPLQGVWQAIGLFFFVFLLFLLAGKLILSTLTALQTDLNAIQRNRRLTAEKAKNLPNWEADIDQLSHEIDAIRAQKWPIITALNHAETGLTQLNSQRDRLVNVFMSEYELARSLRDRRKLLMNYE